MKSREWLFGFFSSLVAVPALAHQVERRDLPTIVRLKERESEILVKSDGQRLFYTVVGDNAEETRENLDLEEIRAWRPELYERLKTTVADPKIDASNRYDEKAAGALTPKSL